MLEQQIILGWFLFQSKLVKGHAKSFYWVLIKEAFFIILSSLTSKIFKQSDVVAIKFSVL